MIKKELLFIARDQLSATKELKVEFTTVCVPNPITLRPEEMVDQPPTAEEQPALDFFHHQRDASMLAMNVVKDLHLASNAENAEHGMSLFMSSDINTNQDQYPPPDKLQNLTLHPIWQAES